MPDDRAPSSGLTPAVHWTRVCLRHWRGKAELRGAKQRCRWSLWDGGTGRGVQVTMTNAAQNDPPPAHFEPHIIRGDQASFRCSILRPVLKPPPALSTFTKGSVTRAQVSGPLSTFDTPERLSVSVRPVVLVTHVFSGSLDSGCRCGHVGPLNTPLTMHYSNHSSQPPNPADRGLVPTPTPHPLEPVVRPTCRVPCKFL